MIFEMKHEIFVLLLSKMDSNQFSNKRASYHLSTVVIPLFGHDILLRGVGTERQEDQPIQLQKASSVLIAL